jgi:hypothetical protein
LATRPKRDYVGNHGADFLGWQQQFGSGMPAAASAVKFVPEPSALAVISLGGSGLALVHRRHR